MEIMIQLLESNKEISQYTKAIQESVAKICEALVNYNQNQAENGIPKIEEPRMYMQEVIHYLGISERTYYRFKEEGKLVPMKIGKRDFCYKSDLLDLFLESKRKGRI